MPEVVRCALFVDFDNVYSHLKRTNERAAEKFATDPQLWLKWIENGCRAEPDTPGAGPVARTLLVRRCYLNPAVFGRYRGYFTRAAFSVVDCPSLTSQGKNSADINMVLDMVDALAHPTRFDEFIILSGDADFTPVLIRLRTHDRRTMVLANEMTAAAYTAACDTIIDQDDFIEHGLGCNEPPPPAMPVPVDYDTIIRNLSARLLRAIDALPPEASAREIGFDRVIEIFQTLSAFEGSNWFGCFSVQKLMSKLEAANPRLLAVYGPDNRLRAVTLRTVPPAAPVPIADVDTGEATAPASKSLEERIIQHIRLNLDRSPSPVLMSKLSQDVINRFGNRVKEERWFGAGSFRTFLERSDPTAYAFAPLNGGMVGLAARHAEEIERLRAQSGGSIGDATESGPLDELPERICRLTGAPRLSREQYGTAYRAIAAVLSEMAAPGEEGFNLTLVSRTVRDRCNQDNAEIGRAAVNFILSGVQHAGLVLDALPPPDEAAIARAFRENVLAQLASAQIELTGDEHGQLDGWLFPAGATTNLDPAGTGEATRPEETTSPQDTAEAEGDGVGDGAGAPDGEGPAAPPDAEGTPVPAVPIGLFGRAFRVAAD